jgi:hypothetical protein
VKNKPNYEQKNAKYGALEIDSKNAGTLVQQGIPAILPLPNTPLYSIDIHSSKREEERAKMRKE